jgi:hypothetical protein
MFNSGTFFNTLFSMGKTYQCSRAIEKVFKLVVVIAMFIMFNTSMMYFPLNIIQTTEIKPISKEYLLKGSICESPNGKSYVEVARERYKFLLFGDREREYYKVYIGDDF